MELAAAVVNPIVSFLLDPLFQHIGYLAELEKNVSSLKEVKTTLNNLKTEILDRVDQAKSEQKVPKETVKDWIDRAEKMHASVEHIESRLNARRTGLPACYEDFCWSNYNLGKQAVKKKVEVDKLINEGEKIEDVAGFRRPTRVERLSCGSAVGTEEVMKSFNDYIKQDDVDIMGLHGMGGVGKTLLLKTINNSLEETTDFDVVIWVGDDKGLTVEEIQKTICKRLCISCPDENTQKRAVILLDKLCEVNCKYLLLLDNIREKLDLNDVGVPNRNNKNKCKVVFTTRDEKVCDFMCADKKIKINKLGADDARRLFAEKVDKEVLKDRNVKDVAYKVVEKCEGLPLALVTVGQALASAKDLEEWKYAESELPAVEGMDNVLSVLKFSYNSLKDEAAKSCFLYCSFFPESSDIIKEQLIRYWIGEGFFDGDEFEKACWRGVAVINRLKTVCLLESGTDEERQVKMHALMHKMARSVARETRVGIQFLLASLTGDARSDKWEEAEIAFLMDQGIKDLPESPPCTNLTTLMLQHNLDLVILDSFFKNMSNLKVLDLSYTNISSLPQTLSDLKNLRYFNLSYTGIKELPLELGNLRSLKQLDLQHTYSLEKIPPTIFSSLFRLEELNMCYSFSNWELDGCVKLDELAMLKSLTSTGITIDNHNFQVFFGAAKCLQNCAHLQIKNCNDLLQMPVSDLAKADKLQKLGIFSCSRLNKLIVGTDQVKENFLGSLKELRLTKLLNLDTIWEETMPPGYLGNLRSLEIEVCDKLKSMRWIRNLQYLEKIKLDRCVEMEEILGDEELGEDSIFKKLKTIHLQKLPKLTNLYSGILELPLLETLVVLDCPGLKRIPLGTDSAGKLKRIEGRQNWWTELMWANDQIKERMGGVFHEPT